MKLENLSFILAFKKNFRSSKNGMEAEMKMYKNY